MNIKQVTYKVFGDVYCLKCECFIGSVCDPFRQPFCKECYKCNEKEDSIEEK